MNKQNSVRLLFSTFDAIGKRFQVTTHRLQVCVWAFRSECIIWSLKLCVSLSLSLAFQTIGLKIVENDRCTVESLRKKSSTILELYSLVLSRLKNTPVAIFKWKRRRESHPKGWQYSKALARPDSESARRNALSEGRRHIYQPGVRRERESVLKVDPQAETVLERPCGVFSLARSLTWTAANGVL